MKVIIAGSRGINNALAVSKAVQDSGFDITEVVSGTAHGVDKEGEWWAGRKNIPVKKFPADWTLFGKQAGHVRNVQMAEYANALIAVWDGSSPGTKDMINEATKRGLPVHVHRVH